MDFIPRIKTALTKPVDGIGLAIFRFFFFGILLFEVHDLYNLRHLFYDRIPYVEPGEIMLIFPFWIWQLSLISIMLGYQTRIATVINYLCVLIFLSGLTTFEYHMDYVYIGISFLAIFLPLAQVLSVDKYLSRWKSLKAKQPLNPTRQVSAYNYYIPVLFGLAIVYADSILFKFISPMWMNGLGMWTPASMAPVTIFNDSILLNQEYIMKSLGYLTLVFEVVFLFLFWFKKFRLPLLIIGIGLHFGIYLEFPIPYFAFGSIAIYLLMVPIGFWNKIETRLLRNIFFKKGIKLIDIGRVWHTKVTPQSHDAINPNSVDIHSRKKWIASAVSILILLQINISLFSPFAYKATAQILEVLPHSISKPLISNHTKLRFVSQKFFGITSHPVFMDGHFKNMTSLALVYVDGNSEVVLPLIDADGMPNENIKGGAWVNWVFRIGPATASRNLDKSSPGILRYTANWLGVNNLDLSEKHTFILKERKMDYPGHWEEDLLERNLAKEWAEIGRAEWDNKEFSMRFNQTETDHGGY